ncbi:MAG: bifunctional metallophosphatase/5'-nucleotidase [Spirochaetae bacterium HGW-Spirochaetae-1]|jgi:5'-nucleotidase|nr:MAG: bifunctional metallophosphatase/5'-nucleotidase [Spirochaetae bacterium HGW-Spirochaetae-1]
MMKKTLYLIIFSFLLVPALLLAGEKPFTIIHTNDMHSHMLGYSPNRDYTPNIVNDDKTVGGWARIATVISDTKKARKSPVLVLDAGDYMMGTLFHMVGREYAFELRTMKQMGYEVVTLGNHEFDLMPRGLARILESGTNLGGIPAVVSSNLIFSKESDKDDSLEKAYEKGLIRPWHIIKKDGITFGFFGLMGKDAGEVAPFASPVEFKDRVEVARKMVALLRNEKKVDVVILLSHSGLWADPEKSEDELLAAEVPGIDIIISGHTHTKLDKPLIVKNTIIAQAWAYCKEVSIIDFALVDGKVVLKKNEFVAVDDSIKGDPAIMNLINIDKTAVNMKVLAPLGLGFDSIIAHTDFEIFNEEAESNLGNMIADSICWYADKFEYDPKDPSSKIDIGVISGGVIRDDIYPGTKGNIAVSDLFRTIPLGIGMDDTMAYPLITIYINAAEVKKALEILTTIYPLKGEDYFLQISGLKFTYNPNRMLFDRVTEIWIGSEEKGYELLDYSSGKNKKLYKACADIYNATFLKIVGSFTKDILKIVPKDKDGNPVSDLVTRRIDANKTKEGIQEVKEWVGLLEYVRSFPDTNGDGIPDVPEKYKGPLGRTVAVASLNPYRLLRRGTWVTWAGFGIIVLLLGLGAGAVVVVRRFVVKKRA